MQIDRNILIPYVENLIIDFHQRRLESIQEIKLKDVIKRKNPYLFRTKNFVTPQDFVEAILDAHLSSQEEGLFGSVLEQLAIHVCEIAYNGRKSAAIGIDLEFERDGIYYIVAIKSGPNWGNSSQISKMKDNFRTAKRVLGTNRSARNIVAVNGCCYGRDNRPEKDEYLKLCGQRFWELISGDVDLYLDIIEPFAHSAEERNSEFNRQYGGVIARMSTEFFLEFCDENGQIVWDKIVKFNSALSPNT